MVGRLGDDRGTCERGESICRHKIEICRIADGWRERQVKKEKRRTDLTRSGKSGESQAPAKRRGASQASPMLIVVAGHWRSCCVSAATATAVPMLTVCYPCSVSPLLPSSSRGRSAYPYAAIKCNIVIVQVRPDPEGHSRGVQVVPDAGGRRATAKNAVRRGCGGP